MAKKCGECGSIMLSNIDVVKLDKHTKEWVAYQPPKVLLENPYLKELVSSLEDYCDFYEPDMIKTERGCRLLNALEAWEEK